MLDGRVPKQTLTVISGVVGGVAQGIFVAPTQRLKTLSMTSDGTQSGWRVAVLAVQRDGVMTLMRGTTPLAIRRGADWGIRFTGWLDAAQCQYVPYR